MSPVPPTPVQLEPQNTALFGSRVPADVTKLRSQRVMLNERGPSPSTTATQRRRPHDVGDQADASASEGTPRTLAAPRARKEAGNQP